MTRRRMVTDAAEILRARYVGVSRERRMALEVERVNAEAAGIIYSLRRRASLSQKALAGLVGTTQSVISRLEDADYEGHSLAMLTKIAAALGRRVQVRVTRVNETERRGGKGRVRGVRALHPTSEPRAAGTNAWAFKRRAGS